MMEKVVNKINKWGVPILILGLPLYLLRFKIFGIPFTVLEVLFFIVFINWLSQKIKRKEFNKKYFSVRRSYPFSFFIILFVLSSFGGLMVAGFSNEALGVYKAYFIEAVFVYILVFNYFKHPANRNRIYFTLFLSAILASVYAIYQKITGNYWAGGVNELRVTSFFPYPNALGLYLGPITVLSYFYFLNLIKNGCPIFRKDKLKVFFTFLVFLISFYSIYLARSEAALGAVVISVFLGSIFISKRFATVFIVLGIVSGTIVLTNTDLRTFVLEKIQLRDFSGEVRKQQWKETVEMLKSDGTVLGVGLSGYQKAVTPYHQEGIFFNEDRDTDFRRKIVLFDDKYKSEHWRPIEIYMYPHNIILNFWVELGVVGVVAFFGLMSQFVYYGIKLFKRDRLVVIGPLSAMLEILIHGMVDVPYFKNDLSFLWWIFFAMMGVYWIENKIDNVSVKK